jgi:hypothetical protein
LVVRDGDKLRTRIVSADDDGVVLETSYQPRNAQVPGRDLRYDLVLDRGPGTTRASLSLFWVSNAPEPGPAELRRWRRSLDQCLERLDAAALAGGAAEEE